jgi:hypothetical protein
MPGAGKAFDLGTRRRSGIIGVVGVRLEAEVLGLGAVGGQCSTVRVNSRC